MGKAARTKWSRRARWPFSKAARLNRIERLPAVQQRVAGLIMDALERCPEPPSREPK